MARTSVILLCCSTTLIACATTHNDPAIRRSDRIREAADQLVAYLERSESTWIEPITSGKDERLFLPATTKIVLRTILDDGRIRYEEANRDDCLSVISETLYAEIIARTLVRENKVIHLVGADAARLSLHGDWLLEQPASVQISGFNPSPAALFVSLSHASDTEIRALVTVVPLERNAQNTFVAAKAREIVEINPFGSSAALHKSEVCGNIIEIEGERRALWRRIGFAAIIVGGIAAGVGAAIDAALAADGVESGSEQIPPILYVSGAASLVFGGIVTVLEW